MIYGVDYETRTMNGIADPSAKPEVPECQGCNAKGLDLTWIGNGWDFFGCPACVAACAEADRKETGCEPEEFTPTPEPMQATLFPPRELRYCVWAFAKSEEEAA